MPRFALPFLALALTVPGALADTILKTDGTAIEDASVVSDGIVQLTYKSGSSDKTLPAEQVLAVTYDRLPPELDKAFSARDDGQLLTAIGDLEAYLEELAAGKKERKEWAPALARHTLVELHSTLGNTDGVIAAADGLIAKSPDSRFVPTAFLAKAAALAAGKKSTEAIATLDQLSSLVDSRGLSNRWKLEADLGRVLYDGSLAPDQRRSRLEAVAAQAGTGTPTVRNRALVAVASAFYAANVIDKAEPKFREVTESGQADENTLAAAYTGLGDCLFAKASAQPQGSDAAKAAFKEALLAYLRVPVLFPAQVDFVPRALFFAGRSFDLLGPDARDNAVALYRRLNVRFPDSSWAREARAFL